MPFQDSGDIDASFGLDVEDEVSAAPTTLAYGKRTYARIEVVAVAANAWILGDSPTFGVDEVNDSIGGGRIVLCDMDPDRDQILIGL